VKASDILRAADAKFDKDLGGTLPSGDRRAFYDKRMKKWIVEYDTDPALYCVAFVSKDGTIRFEWLD